MQYGIRETTKIVEIPSMTHRTQIIAGEIKQRLFLSVHKDCWGVAVLFGFRKIREWNDGLR